MANLTEKYIDYENDGENVTSTIKVFEVTESNIIVGRFFPKKDNEESVKAKAQSFADNFKLPKVVGDVFITKKATRNNAKK